jgi:predicted nucleic acid-binding Zn ribbon protein
MSLGGGAVSPSSSWQPSAAGDGDNGDSEPRSLARSLDCLVTHLGGSHAAVLRDLFGRWCELVGPEIAAHTQPTSLRQGVLVVTVDQPAWATQLRWLTPTLLARLASSLGSDAVTAIDVRLRRLF